MTHSYRRLINWSHVTTACLAVAVLLIAISGCTARPSATPASQPDTAAQASATPKVSRTGTPTSTQPSISADSTSTATPTASLHSDLPTVRYQDLPKQAKDTIRLIEQGGPFPFSRDGVTFQNRERLLPTRPSGYYREYTVITPGSSDRGARRIVAGDDGELYYTNDHYDSFREVIR